MASCRVCYRRCEIAEGKPGFCGVRQTKDGKVTPVNYGKITSMAMDPIEKKPLSRFMPGSRILSIGSFGCNLRCPFCQNHEISWSEEAYAFGKRADKYTPEDIAQIAFSHKKDGNIGVAYTYNEPLVCYEFVRDCAKLVHKKGMVNVLVSNGMASLEVLDEIIPYIDAMNIDLKGFTDTYYRDILGGNRYMVMDFIKEAVRHCHVELTTLIVPGENDTPKEMRELSSWIAGLTDKDGQTIGQNIPLHISRFFPRFKMTDRDATSVRLIYELVDVAREKLNYVYAGNV